MVKQTIARVLCIFVGPFEQTTAGLHPGLFTSNEFVHERGWAWTGVEVWQQIVMDGLGEVEPDEVPFSIGPRTDNRRPKLDLTKRSTSSGLAIPASTIAIASRHSACCIRFPMNPGDVLLHADWALPDVFEYDIAYATVSGPVSAPGITSTSGIRCGGFHQCVPTIPSRPLAPSAIAVMEMTEVLVASTAFGASSARFANSACLTARSSTTASVTKLAPPTAS